MKKCRVAAWILSIALTGFAEPIRVINKGIGGQNTRQGLARFQRDVLDVKPDHLILYFGMNDALNQRKLVPLKEFADNLEKMVELARSGGIKTVVLVTINPVFGEVVKKRAPKHPAKDLDAHLEKYDRAVRQVAEKNKVLLADLRAEFNANGGRDVLVRNALNGEPRDGVHPTAEGYELFAELVSDTLGDRVKAGDTVICLGDSITYGAHMKGQGTIFVDTYPAWLSVKLNGLKRPAALPPAVMHGGVCNGSFEKSTDGVHADTWKMRSGVSDARVIDESAPDGKFILKVSSGGPIVFLDHGADTSIKTGRSYELSFTYRGTGTIQPLLTQRIGRKAAGTVKGTVLELTEEWREGKLSYTASDDETAVSIKFQISGDAQLDDISFEEN